MLTPLARPAGAVPGALCLFTALAFASASCTYKVPIDPGKMSPRHLGRGLAVVLVDGTQYWLDSPRVAEGALGGAPRHCSGPGCTAVNQGPMPLSAVASTSLVEVDHGKSVLAALGLAAASGVVIALAVANSSKPAPPPVYPSGGKGWSSCPHVYSWDGSAWQLDSDTYSVSYLAAAQRTAFGALEHLAEAGGQYRLRLVNELPETEHTDLLQLRVVDHPAGTSVLPDASGALHTFRGAQAPLAATDLRGADALAQVSARDGDEWRSDASGRRPDRPEDTRDGLLLQFARPPGARTAKLRIAARNTPWSGKMMEYLLGQRGSALPAWFARMNSDAGARAGLIGFLVREGMLQVQVRTAAGWQTRAVFWSAGPELVKEEAFALPIADASGDRLEVRLETAVGFWSVDSVAIDYGADEPITVRELAPGAAVDKDGRDLRGVLAAIDNSRYDTVPGDVAELAFAAPPRAPGLSRSFVLVTSGYYLPEVTPLADADPAAIDALMAVPGGASRRSLELLHAAVTTALLR